jgi:L,D-peptidoglycan transpeptidase YkuD (ErfK/YbiS/YcfS/YnhG family)
MNNIIVTSSEKLIFNDKTYRCVMGKNGVVEDKEEGDWGTPVGCFPIREIFYRKDRVEKIDSVFPVRELSEDDGWCDDPKDEKYNQFVKLPYEASHEKLWREDNLYDIIVVLGYNDDPPVPGNGSAVFMHIARPSYSPTAGCIALATSDLLEILENLEKDATVCIESK